MTRVTNFFEITLESERRMNSMKRNSSGAVAFGLVGVVALLFASTGCGNSGDQSDRCAGPQILPDRSPLFFGEVYPPPEDEEDKNPGVLDQTPITQTLLLESTCKNSLEIEKTCLVGENDDGESDAAQFTPTGPKPKTVPTDESAAYRLTYEREEPNDGDDIDNAAIVVQSNAVNYPTLVVPVCARVLEEGEERSESVECRSPVEAPAEGEREEGLCE